MKSFLGSLVLSLVFLFSISVFAGGDSTAGKEEKVSKATTGRSTAAAITTSEEAGLYKAKCASCHGAAGEGSEKIAKMLKLDEASLQLTSAATKKASDADLLKVLLDGRGKMPSFKGKVSDDEAKKLIQYLRTFKK